MRSPVAVTAVPALPAQVPLDVPRWFWVVVEHTELGIADGTKINLLVIVGVFFIKTRLAKHTPLLHLPLPLCLVAASNNNLFAAYRANVRRLRLLEHKLPCLFYVAVAAEQAFNPPVFAGLVLVAPKLLATHSAVHDLLFAENVQAKLLAFTGTKTYVGASQPQIPVHCYIINIIWNTTRYYTITKKLLIKSKYF